MKGNRYSNAKLKAVLRHKDVVSAWGHGAWSTFNLAFVNRAFEIYYKAKRNISAIRDMRHSIEMQNQIEDCATEGWGFGIDDLDEAFQHLTKNKGRWYDDSTSRYFPGPRKAYCAKMPSVSGPTSVVNFMEAVDEKIVDLLDYVDNYNKAIRKYSIDVNRKEWKNISKTLNLLRKISKGVKPLLWTAPVSLRIDTIEFKGRVPAKKIITSKSAQGAPWQTSRQRAWSRSLTYVETVAKLEQAVDTFTSARKAGLDGDTSALLSSLRFVMRSLKVLGGFYAEAVAIAPAIVSNYRSIIKKRTEMLDSIGKTP